MRRVSYTSVCVLYTTTSERHREAYAMLAEMYRTVEWVDESSFRADLIRIVGTEPLEHLTVFHTDDDVFFRAFSPPVLRDDEVCFSLRLGVNIVYCYPLDIPERAKGASLDGSRLRWSWRGQGPGSFAYPLSLNGHVFRTTDVAAMARRGHVRKPERARGRTSSGRRRPGGHDGVV